MAEQLDSVDFALAAFRVDGVWQVQELAHDLLADVESLAEALRRLPGDVGAVALIAMDEDFFVILRVSGTQVRLMLSDITAADEWDLAGSVIDFLGLPDPDDDDEQVPAGDLDLLSDLGVSALDFEDLLGDFDLYPDEMLSDIARKLGFGEMFDDAIDLASA